MTTKLERKVVKIMSKILIGVLTITIIALAGNTFAAELYGTGAGTTIQNISIVSADNASAQQATKNTNVRRIGGAQYTTLFGGNYGIPADANGTAGNVSYFPFTIRNMGNSADSFTLRIVSTNTNAAVSANYKIWTNQIVQIGSDTVINTTGLIAAGASFDFRLRVRPLPTALVNSWVGYQILAISFSNATATNYQGDVAGGSSDHYAGDIGEDWNGAMNATYYGRLTHGGGSISGTATSNRIIQLFLQGPVLNIAKRIQSISGPMGTLPVPGSTITYVIVVSNTGSATANNVRVFDSVPANTTFKSATVGAQFTSYSTNGFPVTYVRWAATKLTNATAASKDSVTFSVRIN